MVVVVVVDHLEVGADEEVLVGKYICRHSLQHSYFMVSTCREFQEFSIWARWLGLFPCNIYDQCHSKPLSHILCCKFIFEQRRCRWKIRGPRRWWRKISRRKGWTRWWTVRLSDGVKSAL